MPLVFLLVFKYLPMLGNVIAFRRFRPGGSIFGDEWVGWPLLEDGTISKRGRMLAHYAKFIRPGHVRVEAPKEPRPGLLTSAYTGDDGTFVLVAVNTATATADQAFTVKGHRVRRARPWLTDATRDLEPQPAISGQGNAFTASLPPESVTTFVITT